MMTRQFCGWEKSIAGSMDEGLVAKVAATWPSALGQARAA